MRIDEPRVDAAAEAVLDEAVKACARALGDRLIAAYALGSLAHGGFSPLVSDVDLGIVVADPVRASDGETIQRVADKVATGGSELHARLSVFWGTPATLSGHADGGRFPPLDRLDLLQHGRLLCGADARAGLPEPARAELVVAGAEFALALLARDDVVESIRRPELLLCQGILRVTKLVLFPVRFLYTAETGLVGANEAAAALYASAGAPGASLVTAALRWRTIAPARAEALKLLERDLPTLYRHYLEDHEARLAALGRRDLSEAFGVWRSRLDAP